MSVYVAYRPRRGWPFIPCMQSALSESKRRNLTGIVALFVPSSTVPTVLQQRATKNRLLDSSQVAKYKAMAVSLGGLGVVCVCVGGGGVY